jgi:murein tripeptide amidase MpaA
VEINSAFDGGNIAVVAIDGDVAQLEIVRDAQCDYFQWFYFRVSGARERVVTLNIINAGQCSYGINGWPGYQARYSTDRLHWLQQSNTRYENGVLTIEHHCQTDLVWFAYFAPYPMERHHSLIARMANLPGVEHIELGCSLEGQSIDCLQLGNTSSKAKQIWLFGRQHPGESMAQWWLEGALECLTEPAEEADASIAQSLLQQCRFHIVPNMNPDGSCRGHHRTNAKGIDLNRQWAAPSLESSPEVYWVWQAMLKSGVDFSMDVHGDENIPANFVAGFRGIPNFRLDKWALFTEFRSTLTAQNHDFQDQLGYAESADGKANLALATNQIANHFGSVSVTLEMPFKDHAAHAVPAFGWNPVRCKGLANACLRVLAGIVPRL